MQCKVRCNFRCRMHREIPPGESFEEALDLCSVRGACLNPHSLQQKYFVRGMQAIAVECMAKVIRRSHEKLPQHLRLPRGQSFRVYGVNVRIRKQAKSLQSFWCRYRFCES